MGNGVEKDCVSGVLLAGSLSSYVSPSPVHIHIHIFLFPACFLLQAFEAQNSLMGEELSRRTEVEVW